MALDPNQASRCNSPEPGSRVPRARPRLSVSPHGDEGVLQRIEHDVVIDAATAKASQDPRSVAIMQRAQRRWVSPHDTGKQFRVG